MSFALGKPAVTKPVPMVLSTAMAEHGLKDMFPAGAWPSVNVVHVCLVRCALCAAYCF